MVCQLYQEMRYKALRTGEINFFVERDIQDQMEDIQKEARRQVKIRCILQEITETEQIQISREELESEAEAMAERQHTTVREIKSFFGENLDMLREDLLVRKTIQRICKREARRQVKIRCILQEITETEQIQISREELESEAEAMAERQHTTVREIKSFFGENLDMLREDLLVRKTIQRICKSAVIL